MEKIPVKEILLLVFLLINAGWDFKKREIMFHSVLVFGMIGISILLLQSGLGMEAFLIGAAGIIPGIIVFGIAWMTREAVGYGDGAVIVVCGIYLGILETIALLFYALLLCSAMSAVLLMLKRGGRKTEVPFVPHLLFGFCCVMLF